MNDNLPPAWRASRDRALRAERRAIHAFMLFGGLVLLAGFCFMCVLAFQVAQAGAPA